MISIVPNLELLMWLIWLGLLVFGVSDVFGGMNDGNKKRMVRGAVLFIAFMAVALM
jgi:hypothetical protein